MLKAQIQAEIMKHESEKMLRFLKQLGPRPLSTVPMWRKITRMRNQRRSQEIPTLITGETSHTTNESKAKVFENKMRYTFNENENSNY